MRYSIAIFVLVFTVGCVPKDSIRYITLPSKSVEQVDLLLGPPTKPFRIVGNVFIEGARTASWESVVEAAREEAADMGADAVFMGQAGEYQAGTVIMPSGSPTTTTGTMSRSSANMTSNTYAGQTVATEVRREQFTGIAIMYENP